MSKQTSCLLSHIVDIVLLIVKIEKVYSIFLYVMTQQQIQQQQQQQIHFTIQTLDGETFQVSIPVTDAEKV